MFPIGREKAWGWMLNCIFCQFFVSNNYITINCYDLSWTACLSSLSSINIKMVLETCFRTAIRSENTEIIFSANLYSGSKTIKTWDEIKVWLWHLFGIHFDNSEWNWQLIQLAVRPVLHIICVNNVLYIDYVIQCRYNNHRYRILVPPAKW